MSDQITTTAQLDALPVGSRVFDGIGDGYVKLPDGTWDTPFDDTPAVSVELLASWGPLSTERVDRG